MLVLAAANLTTFLAISALVISAAGALVGLFRVGPDRKKTVADYQSTIIHDMRDELQRLQDRCDAQNETIATQQKTIQHLRDRAVSELGQAPL